MFWFLDWFLATSYNTISLVFTIHPVYICVRCRFPIQMSQLFNVHAEWGIVCSLHIQHVAFASDDYCNTYLQPTTRDSVRSASSFYSNIVPYYFSYSHRSLIVVAYRNPYLSIYLQTCFTRKRKPRTKRTCYNIISETERPTNVPHSTIEEYIRQNRQDIDGVISEQASIHG